MEQRKQLRFVTILYGIAAVLVVFGHSHPLHIEYPRGPVDWVYRFHMPLFFLIAGILTAYTASGREIWPWWKRKAVRLLVPYVVLTLAAWVPKILLDKYMNNDMAVSLENFVRILLIPREGVWGHFWFIPVYLMLEMCAAVIWRYLENTSGLIRGGVLLVAVFMKFFPIGTDWFGLRDMTSFFIYVLLGLYLSKPLAAYDKKQISLLPGLICLVVGTILFLLVPEERVWNFISCLILMGAMLLFSLWMSGRRISWSNVFFYFGKRVFTVYIYAWPIQAVLELLVVVVLKGSWQCCFVVLFLCGLCGPVLLYEIYFRYFPHCTFLDLMIGVKKYEGYFRQNPCRSGKRE